MARLSRRLVIRLAAVASLSAITGCTESPPGDTEMSSSHAGRSKTHRGSAELQRLVDRAHDLGGVVSLRAADTFVLTDPVNLRGITLDGHGAVLRAAEQFNGHGLLVCSGKISIRDVHIVGEGTSARGLHGIYASAIPTGCALTVHGVTVEGFGGDGIFVQAARDHGRVGSVSLNKTTVSKCDRGAAIFSARVAEFTSCRFVGCKRSGVQIVRSSNVNIDSCVARNNGYEGPADGFVATYSQKVRFKGSHARGNTGRGFSLGGGDPLSPPNKDWTIDSCTASENRGHGITIDPTVRGEEGMPVSSPGMILNSLVSANGGNGINVTCAADLLIQGNTSRLNHDNGISIASARVRVVDNTAYGNLQQGIVVFRATAMRPEYKNVVVSGNHVYRNQVAETAAPSVRH